MIIKAKAVKKQCLSQYCQVLKLTATRVNEAKFLAHLHLVVARGGKVTVEDKVGNTATFTYEPAPDDSLPSAVENPHTDKPVQG